MNVEKRDGTIQQFDFGKIEKVVKATFSNKMVNEPIPEKFIDQLKKCFADIVSQYDSDESLGAFPVENIREIIRDFLIKKNKNKAVEAFILECKRREERREEKSWLSKEIAKKLKGTAIENQNANLDEASFGGRNGEANRVVTKDYALKHCMSKKSRTNHENNINYIHDLDNFAVGMHNCLTYPIDKSLKEGFNTRQTDVRRANSVNTAGQLTAVLIQLQSLQQFGGVSASHIDWTMVPYIRKSFEKNYVIEYIKECDGFMDIDLLTISDRDLKSWVSKKTIEFFARNDFKDEDCKFENKNRFNQRYYQNALLETRNEVYQAVEGMYHNLR